jgi:hypothetical protein
MISTAALLAGTVVATGQGAVERKEGGANAQQPGVSQSQPKGAQQGQQREERGNQVQREPSKPSTSGQAPRSEEQKVQDNKQDNKPDNQRALEEKRSPAQTQRDQEQKRPGTQTQRSQDEKDQKGTQGQNQGDQKRTEGRAEQGAKANGGTSSVALSTEQRTKLRQTVIEGRSAPRVDKIDFSITEGTVIPRSVHVVVVPETIVEIHPEWRGYRYFVYNDEIIIVEPDSLRIVAIVEV